MNFSLKPVFIGWITFLCQLPLQIFITLWCGGFFGGMLVATGWFLKDSPMPFIICGVVGFAVCGSITYFGKQLNYMRTEYHFYDDRVEFEEGFFTINKKVIKYKDVKEVSLRKGIFQRMYGLGTIYLGTLATGSSQRNNIFEAIGFGNISASGVGIRDVANPDEAFEKIKARVDALNV